MQEYSIFHQQVGKSSGGHKEFSELCFIQALLLLVLYHGGVVEGVELVRPNVCLHALPGTLLHNVVQCGVELHVPLSLYHVL